MKKFAKLISVLLAVVMVVGMIPMVVNAVEDTTVTKTYTRVTTLDEVTDGNYVVVLENGGKYYAMTDKDYNLGTEVTVATDLMSVSGDLYTWNLRVQSTADSSKTVTLHNDGLYWYRTDSASATLGFAKAKPTWTVTAADGFFKFESVNVDDAYISINGTAIKGYDSTKGYNTNVLLFKEAGVSYAQVSEIENGGQYAIIVHYTNDDGVDIYRAMDTVYRIDDTKIASASISANAVNDTNGTINDVSLPVWTFTTTDGVTSISCGDVYLDCAGNSTAMSLEAATDAKAATFNVTANEDNTFSIGMTDSRSLAYRYNSGDTIYNLFAAYAVTNDKDRGTTSQYDFHLYLYEVVDGAAMIQNESGNTVCTDVAAALNAAASGDTVVMLADANISGTTVAVPTGVTLDLNGHELTCARLTADENANVIDSTADHSGRVNVPSTALSLKSTNTYLPIIVEENVYMFVDVKMQQMVTATTEDSITILYKPSLSAELNQLLADGGEAEGVKVGVKVYCTTAEGEGNYDYNFENTIGYYDDVYGGTQAFKLTITGISEYVDVQVQVYIKSASGVMIMSDNLVDAN